MTASELHPVSANVERIYSEIAELLAKHGDSQSIARALVSAYQAGHEVCRFERGIEVSA